MSLVDAFATILLSVPGNTVDYDDDFADPGRYCPPDRLGAVPLATALPPAGAGPLDDLAPYQPQTTCSPSPKPGVDGFRRIVPLTSFPGTPSYGISRDCSIGGRKQTSYWDGTPVTYGMPSTDPQR